MTGQRVRRREDPWFLTGNGRYVDDLELPGALHVAFVRSDLAHARIVQVDASGAAALPGVQVLSAADIDLGALSAVPRDPRRHVPPVRGWRQGPLRG